MAKPKQATEQRLPVDNEDDDRRLDPQVDSQPQEQPSAQQDEHRGLAARILDIRKAMEANAQKQAREREDLKQNMARIEQLLSGLTTRIDREVESIQKQQTELRGMLHDGGEQVRQAGAVARRVQDGMRELEELRAVASDPHEVVKPVQRAIAHLRTDHEALAKTIDVRFEQLPRQKPLQWESRGEDEDPVLKLEVEVRKLRQRVDALAEN